MSSRFPPHRFVTRSVTRALANLPSLEIVAARTGMHELLVRAYLHRAALGSPDAYASAAMFAARIDNPTVLRRVREAAPVAA